MTNWARDSLWYDRDGALVRWKTRRGHLVESAYDVLHRRVKKWGTQTTTDTITYFTATSPVTPSWVKAENAHATETVYLNSTTGLAERTELVLGARTYNIYAQYLTGATGAGLLDSVWAAGPPGTTFMGRRYLWTTINGTFGTLRLGGKDATMGYDSKQRPITTTFFGGNVTNRDFITSDPLARVEPNQAPLASLGRQLEYGLGRVYSQFERAGPADLGHIFRYDKLGQIKTDTAAMVAQDECFWDPGFGWRCPNPTPDSVVTYTYDAVGNVLRDSLYRVWNGTTLVQTGTYGTGNRIQSFGACSYTTAADGTVTQRTCGGTVTDLWWSSEGRLDSLRHAGTMIRNRYDGSGRLVERQVGISRRYFLWHGDHLFAELDANGVDLVEYSYYPGMDRPHAIGLADSVYFHHSDGLGNVIGLVKHDQALRAQYTYALRGNATWSSEDLSGQTNRARFKGALRFGEETELYYMRNRWYEPKTGRFLSEDPSGLAGGINPCVYAGNDPVNLSDPSGLEPTIWLPSVTVYGDAWYGDAWFLEALDATNPRPAMFANSGGGPREHERAGGRGASVRSSTKNLGSQRPSCTGAWLAALAATAEDVGTLAGITLVWRGAKALTRLNHLARIGSKRGARAAAELARRTGRADGLRSGARVAHGAAVSTGFSALVASAFNENPGVWDIATDFIPGINAGKAWYRVYALGCF